MEHINDNTAATKNQNPVSDTSATSPSGETVFSDAATSRTGITKLADAFGSSLDDLLHRFGLRRSDCIPTTSQARTIYRTRAANGLWVRTSGTERSRAEAQAHMERCGWSATYAAAEWSANPNLTDGMIAEITGYAAGLRSGTTSYGLFITGNYGTGKTSLMGLIARFLACTTDTPPLFLNPATIGNTPMDERAETMNRYATAPLLFIDDFGFTRTTDYVAEAWRELMELRYSHSLLTICSSNMTIADIAAIPAFSRIASQLSDTRWMREYVLGGVDCRANSHRIFSSITKPLI